MTKDFPFKNLIEALHDRIPQRGKLADVLTELLGIEKEAVYRRLRGSVPFSFREVHTIAVHLGFSLDGIAENITLLNRQMTVLAADFLKPEEKDYKTIESFIENVNRLKEDTDSESGSVGSVIPSSICVNYDSINNFYLFKGAHQFRNPHKLKTFAEINTPERLKQLNQQYVKAVRSSPKSVYIFDRRLIEHFVNDVRFFFDIRLITKEDILRLKEDLHLLLNDLEHYAVDGSFGAGNKTEIFLANIHLDANYYYIDSMKCKLTMIRSLSFSDSYSFDEVIFQNMKYWLNFLKRTSTLISEGNATERIRFFEHQRKLVEEM
jgi:hypothetical protein